MASSRCLYFLVALSLSPVQTAEASGHSLVMRKDTIDFGRTSLVFARNALLFGTYVEAHETSSTIEVTLAADVLFDFDRSDIRDAAAAAALRGLADLIRSRARGSVGIRGYTDGLGSDAYNQRLSQRRAASVKAWLVERENLPGSSLVTAGFGARDPVAPNRRLDGSDDPEGRQRNRRVSILIRK